MRNLETLVVFRSCFVDQGDMLFRVRDPMPAVFFFLIDVSMNAIQTGATAAACSAISQVIADLPEGLRTMVGIATFDLTIHFYNLKRALQQPLMLIVPDVHDVYTPLQTDVIVPLSECRQHLELLLENIPTMFQDNRTADSAFGAAVQNFLCSKEILHKSFQEYSCPSTVCIFVSAISCKIVRSVYIIKWSLAQELVKYANDQEFEKYAAY
ncbi:unnamed protein product [Ilex paraguariensis]|uniref:Sec23/Sec24 trunk domain-containing protein n=1 Tax=Ilex paraguariensis TaxID=185542 RepID=A0ABC8SN57_9AQUA